MTTVSRVARRYLDQKIAEKVASRRIAMSLADAKKTLGFPPTASPSDSEVNQAFRQKYIENRKLHPDSGGDPNLAVQLNVAKDTLLGNLRVDRGTPEKERSRPPKSTPIPCPDTRGTSFSAAWSSAPSVEWKVASNATQTSQYIIEEGRTEADGTPLGYWEIQIRRVFLGVNSAGRYVLGALTHYVHNRRTGTSDSATSKDGWDLDVETLPANVNLLKVVPKKVLGLALNSYGRPKYAPLDSTKPTVHDFNKLRTTVSFPDALAGAGITQDTGKERKIQVELEAVANPKYDAKDRSSWYHWFVYVNGKQTALSQEEARNIFDSFIPIAVFNNQLPARKSLTNMRGSRWRIGPGQSLKTLAEAVKAGPLRTAIEQAAAQFPDE